MKLTKLNENKTLAEYEKEWEEQNGKTCDKCGTKLNDGGTCPKCDDGEESLQEKYTKDEMVDKLAEYAFHEFYYDLGYLDGDDGIRKLFAEAANKLIEEENEHRADIRNGFNDYFEKHFGGPLFEKSLNSNSSDEFMSYKTAIESHKANGTEKELDSVISSAYNDLNRETRLTGPEFNKLCDLANLPDRKIEVREAYDPQEFNPDATGPIYDMNVQFYSSLEKAIKEERWEDAAKEYCEIKADLDQELQNADRKPIVGKLFKLFAKPHLRVLDNYKRRIPAEYLNDCDKKNENLIEGLEYIENIDEIRKSANGIQTEFEYTRFYRPKIYLPTDKGGKGELRIMAIKENPDEEDSDWEICVEFEDKSGFYGFDVPAIKLADELHNNRNPYLNGLTFEEAEDICSEIREYFMNVDQEDLYSTFVDKLGCDKKAILKFYNDPSLNEAVVDKFYIDEIVSAQGGKTETERHSFDTIEELKQYVKGANLTPEDIENCGKCEVKDLFESDAYLSKEEEEEFYNELRSALPKDGRIASTPKDTTDPELANKMDKWLTDKGYPSTNEALGVGAGLALGGAAIGAGMVGSALLDSLDKDEEGEDMDELFDIKVDAKGFGGSGNNVHVGPGSMPLTASLDRDKEEKRTRHYGKDYDDEFTLMGY